MRAVCSEVFIVLGYSYNIWLSVQIFKFFNMQLSQNVLLDAGFNHMNLRKDTF